MTVRDHRARLVLHRQEHALQTDVDDEIPIGFREFGDLAETAEAGGVECNVETAEAPRGGRRHRFDLRFDPHVDSRAGDRVAEFARRRRQRRVVDVADDDFRALCDEPPRDREPDAGRAAGDDADFAFEPAIGHG